jgi:hypothetical protein
MSYPGANAAYRQCIWCSRPFRVWRFQLVAGNRGKFCTRQCYDASRRAFSEALADGRLEGILAPERERAKAERLQLLREKAWL